jgi:hypothetical protein
MSVVSNAGEVIKVDDEANVADPVPMTEVSTCNDALVISIHKFSADETVYLLKGMISA